MNFRVVSLELNIFSIVEQLTCDIIINKVLVIKCKYLEETFFLYKIGLDIFYTNVF